MERPGTLSSPHAPDSCVRLPGLGFGTAEMPFNALDHGVDDGTAESRANDLIELAM